MGSGRAARAFTESLAEMIKSDEYNIRGVPTSLQIRLIAEKYKIPLVEANQVEHIDVVFDGADQINSERYLIKGGGGALLQENILFSHAKKIVVMADKTKFVRNFTMAVPVEVHPLARNPVTDSIIKMGGEAHVRTLQNGYPFFTENGNIILDCDFGTIKNPRALTKSIKQTAGVLESGIFLKRPNVIYKAKANNRYDIL